MRALAIAIFSLATHEAVSEPDLQAGKELYDILCATCHDFDGRGDGPMTEFLTVQPTDLTLLQTKNDGVFPTFRVTRQIDGRDPLLPHGGEMPLFGALLTAQDTAIQSETGQLILTSQSIADLVMWLKEIQEAE